MAQVNVILRVNRPQNVSWNPGPVDKRPVLQGSIVTGIDARYRTGKDGPALLIPVEGGTVTLLKSDLVEMLALMEKS